MADFAVDIVHTTIPTSTGVVNYTFALGGRTPKAVLVIAGYSINKNNSSAHVNLCWGAADASTQWACSAASESAVSTTNTFRRGAAGKLVQLLNPNTGAATISGVLSSFSADTVSVNWTSVLGSSRTITLIALAGDDLQVNNQIKVIASAGTTSVTTAFEPNVVAVGHIGNVAAFGDSVVVNNRFGQGFITNYRGTVRHGSMHGFSLNNSSPSSCRGIISGSRITILSAAEYFNAGSFSPSGYVITPTGFTGDRGVGLLHLGLPSSVKPWVGILSTPTADGQVTYNASSGTAPGLDFNPLLAIMLGSRMTTEDSFDAGSATAIGATRSTVCLTSGGKIATIGATDRHAANPSSSTSQAWDQDEGDGEVNAIFNDDGTVATEIAGADLSGEGVRLTFDKVTDTDASRFVLFGIGPANTGGFAGGGLSRMIQDSI